MSQNPNGTINEGMPDTEVVAKAKRRQYTPEAFHKAITVLTRGIMARLFVNQWAVNSE